MTRRTYAADDEEVGRRLAELRSEQTRQLSCTCRPSDDGGRIETTGCPVHSADLGLVELGLYWPSSSRLSECGVRVDRDRPRVTAILEAVDRKVAASFRIPNWMWKP